MKIITSKQMLSYLRTLAETGNASLAAARARVSRDWAYKKRKADAVFDARCREMMALFRALRDPPSTSSAAPQDERRVRRVQVRRDRKGGWTPEGEARFLAALEATLDVPIAAASAGMNAPSAYRRRLVRPGFALGWSEALREGKPQIEWIEAAECFFEGRPAPDDNPVRVSSIDEVLRMMARGERAERRRRG